MNPPLVSPFVSVVLCAHNPRADYLLATLQSLRNQDLPLSAWELIVIDNRSDEPWAGRIDLSWHPNARIVVESELGLARARRRGYIEARGDLIVHSDDDNILSPNYLRSASEIFRTFPQLGAFGGQLVARFERAPRNELERRFGGERLLEGDRWSNIPDDTRTMPFGAGMCLRREVINAYLAQVATDPRRLSIGRTGNRLLTGEDIDLNLVATSLGLGTGLFERMTLEHFIPERHMTADHVIRYGAANAYSIVILHFLHFGRIVVPRRSIAGATLFWLRVWIRMTPFERRLELAMHRARAEAVRDLRAWGWSK
ncbi:MAG TPA: glycosyltransferase [Opitutaceae bacterium]|nr:glycosyltransferase [Opitutaceae bacterium]